MPLQFSMMNTGFWHKPQDFIKRLHKTGEDALADKIRCLPLKHRSKSHVVREEAVRKLTHDVELLNEQFPDCNSVASGDADNEGLRLKLSQDVQIQVHKIFALLKELGGEDRGALAGQRHTPALEEDMDLLEAMLAADLPVQLLADLPLLEFEARNDVMNMCCALLWTSLPQHIEDQVLKYLGHHPRVFSLLADGYGKEETALHYGVVLRSCARHAGLVEAFLSSGRIYDLIQYAQHPSFDIASDAFYTLKEFLLEHKEVSAAWLEVHSSEFFQCYNALLQSEQYLVERQALTLLGGMLLDRHFKKVTLAYVNDDKNLIIHMKLLKDSSKAIQLEAFQVFKIFAANPNKAPRVQSILFKNKDKLVSLLQTLHPVKPDDDQKFSDEQKKIIEKLRPLSPPPRCPGGPTASTAMASTVTAM